jgi:hypothetical protein
VKKAFWVIFHVYFYPMAFCVRISKQIGIIGELLTTIIGLPWMLWPMIVPWYLSNKMLYLPCIIVTCIFIVTGRKILNAA